MAKKTYTYTARNIKDPAQVVTFTLHDQNMSVELGAPVEHIERAFESGKEGKAMAGSSAWLKPLVTSLLERGTRPFHVADVDASAENGSLRVMAWNRSGGLRLAPIIFDMGEVDNPVAAKAFERELKRRKQAAEHPSNLPAPLDYWASWVLATLTTFIVLTLWFRKIRQQTTG
ncbi:MAG: hypothetical protein JW953_20790 [Anaerolineae bacterium]|nr:hypothetical protein [Anaerolineae bacterium]